MSNNFNNNFNSNYSNNSNNNFINNRRNGRRNRNFQGSIASTDYSLPDNFAQQNIQFPKAPSFGQFTPSNSGIKRDWSGSEMQVPEFKGLNAVGKGLQKKYQSGVSDRKKAEKEKNKKPTKVVIVGSEGENDNPASRVRPDGSPIKSFPSFGDDSEDSGSQDSGSPTKKRGATRYDENGELMLDLDAKWTMGDVGRSAKELFKWGKTTNSDRKAKKGMKDREEPDTPDFDAPFA
jgi:hypothetical protein